MLPRRPSNDAWLRLRNHLRSPNPKASRRIRRHCHSHFPEFLMNTIEFLQISSAVVPDREALVEVGGAHDQRITYEEMYPRVVKLANAMQSLGLEQGQKVATMAQNSADFVITYYACAMLGVTFVPLNYRSKDEELTHMLNVSQCQALLVSSRYIELVNRIRPTLTSTQHYIAFEGAP